MVGLEMTLHRSNYPIPFAQLYEKLGGKNTMAESWACGSKDHKRLLYYCTIGRLRESEGAYQIEFELDDSGPDPKRWPVLGARLCFMSAFGLVFYAEDLSRFDQPSKSEERGANKSPEATTLARTPAAGVGNAPMA
jgi:hypothetical protein